MLPCSNRESAHPRVEKDDEEPMIDFFGGTDSTGTWDSDASNDEDDLVEQPSLKKYVDIVLNDQGLTVTIEEDASQQAVSCRLWTAALMLSGYLRRPKSKSDLLIHKSVLEIGAGLGICGFTAAANGVAHVTIGDCGPQSLDRLVQSLQKYQIGRDHHETQKSNITICRHLWEEDLEFLQAKAEERSMDTIYHWSKYGHSNQVPTLDSEATFDTVIGSDLLYFSSQEQPLLAALRLHLKQKGVAVLLQTMRTNNVCVFGRFIETARSYFDVHVVDVTPQELCDGTQLHLASETPHTTGYKLVTLRRRRDIGNMP